MPLHQDIEGGQGEGQPRLEIRPHPMQALFKMTDCGQHRQRRLDQHARVPGATMTELEIGPVPVLGMVLGLPVDRPPISQ
jgi:hypothetical protein